MVVAFFKEQPMMSWESR